MIAITSACVPDTEAEGFSFPKADIIYQALNNQLSSGTGEVESNNLIGFVNADGTGNTFIRLKYRVYQPVYSMEAGGLFFHENTIGIPNLLGGGGPTYFLSNSGIYTYCGSFVGGGFIFPVKGTGYLLDVIGRSIELEDMKTCRAVKTLLTIPDELPWVKSLGYAYPSSSGKSIVFAETYRSPWHHVIYMMDIQSGAVREVLQGGRNPSFSPDDQKIAYIGDEGIYVANADGTDNRLIVKIDISSYEPEITSLEPYPFWSPDGKSLVYHKCVIAECLGENLSDFSIFKVDVNSGVEQKIVDSGLFPVWIR
jgi:hypothetical protein